MLPSKGLLEKEAQEKGLNQSCIVVRRVKFIEARRRTSDGLKSFASTKTNSQVKATHTLPLGNDGNRCGRYVKTIKDQREQFDQEPTFLQQCGSFVK